MRSPPNAPAPRPPARAVLLAGLTAAAAAGLGGCSAYRSPTFEAVGVREVERTDEHAVLVFTIQATNPNREPMPLRRADYTVRLGEDAVFTGTRSPESTVNTFGTHRFELPAVVPAEVAARTGEVPYSIRGTVIYRRPGALADVLFDASISVPEAALDLSGTVNLGG